jgi:hypothetical protein
MPNITIPTVATELQWYGDGAPELVITVNEPFLTSAEVPVLVEGVELRVTCTLNSDKKVVIPQITLSSTEDSPDRPTARYLAHLEGTFNGRRRSVPFSVFGGGFSLSVEPAVQTWADIRTNNIGTLPTATIGNKAVSGDFSVGGDLDVAGETALGGDLDVTGAGTFAGRVTATGYTGIKAADIPGHPASKITSGQFPNSRTTATTDPTPNTIVQRDAQGNINGTFVGNGAGLTGIGTGTGGVINTGSTTIGADSDADGVGKISFQIAGVEVAAIENDGTGSGLFERQATGGVGLMPAPARIPEDGYLPFPQEDPSGVGEGVGFQSMHLLLTKSGQYIGLLNTGATENDGTTIRLRRSYDQGLTWTEPVIVSNPPVGRQWVLGGAGVSETGRIFYSYLETGPNETPNYLIGYSYSDDEGETWSTGTTLSFGSLTPNLYAPYGEVITAANGRIIITGWCVEGYQGFQTSPDAAWYPLVWLSDDDGETFGAAIAVASGGEPDGTDYTESCVAYLGGSRVLMLARVNAVPNAEITGPEQFLSEDNGETWASQGFANDFGIKTRPVLMVPYLGIGGRRRLSCYTNDGFGGVYVVTGDVEDITDGPEGWDTDGMMELFDDSHYAAYPFAIHPNGYAQGLVTYYRRYLGNSQKANVALQNVDLAATAERVEARTLAVRRGVITPETFGGSNVPSQRALFEVSGGISLGSSIPADGVIIEVENLSYNLAGSRLLRVRSLTSGSLTDKLRLTFSGLLVLPAGSIYLPGPGSGLYLTQPNGTIRTVTLDNSGALVVSAPVADPEV